MFLNNTFSNVNFFLNKLNLKSYISSNAKKMKKISSHKYTFIVLLIVQLMIQK